MLTTCAKSKLILAGEHAVLYGAHAITTQLDWQTRCHWQMTDVGSLILSDQVEIKWNRALLSAHWADITHRHQAWQKDPHQVILPALAYLPLAVLAWWQQHYSLPLHACRIESQIPIGYGLGSSASLIVAMLRGLMALSGVTLSLQALQQIATQLESLAHGRSSGLDVAALLHGERLLWTPPTHAVLPSFPLTGYWVNTGKPSSSTADCVRHVREHHAEDVERWQVMTQAIHSLHQALLAQFSSDVANIVRQLQAHLMALGVVPAPVQAFTQAIEALGWSGKLCGAGSVTGEGGGFFWLLADEDPKSVCDAFGYTYGSLAQVMDGVDCS